MPINEIWLAITIITFFGIIFHDRRIINKGNYFLDDWLVTLIISTCGPLFWLLLGIGELYLLFETVISSARKTERLF